MPNTLFSKHTGYPESSMDTHINWDLICPKHVVSSHDLFKFHVNTGQERFWSQICSELILGYVCVLNTTQTKVGKYRVICKCNTLNLQMQVLSTFEYQIGQNQVQGMRHIYHFCDNYDFLFRSLPAVFTRQSTGLSCQSSFPDSAAPITNSCQREGMLAPELFTTTLAHKLHVCTCMYMIIHIKSNMSTGTQVTERGYPNRTNSQNGSSYLH